MQKKFAELLLTKKYTANECWNQVFKRSSPQQAYLLSISNQVKQYIENRKDEIILSKDVTNAEVLDEFKALAFSSLTDVITWTEDGNVKIRASSDLDISVKKAIKKIKHYKRDYYDKDGKLKHTDNNIEIEMHDKQVGLDKLGLYLRMWEKKQGDTYIVNNFLQQIQNKYGTSETVE